MPVRAVLAFVVLVAACSLPAPSAAAPPVHRIVSLVPSLTEDLFAIGAGREVIAVSAYTDHPAQASRLPVVASFVSVATERIVALHPDLVVGIPSQSARLTDLRRARIRTVLVPDDSLADIFRGLRALGALTGRRAAAEAECTRLRARTAALVRRVAIHGRRPSVLVVLGQAPIYTVGDRSFIAELIRLAGGRNAASGVRAAYAPYSAEALVADQPDVLIADRTVQLAASLGKPPWNALRAVREHRVFITPDSGALYRPGPRYNEGLAWLIGALARVRTTVPA